jgi:hypothetical protein
MIHTVLDTYLITGYVGFEWKHQLGIPIFGSEQVDLYNESVRTLLAQDRVGSTLSILARNASMVRTLIALKDEYDNPMLFAGLGHLPNLKDELFQQLLQALPPSRRRTPAVRNINRGLAGLLLEAGLGLTVLEAVGTDRPEESKDNWTWYFDLFRAQQAGSYDAYIQRSINRARFWKGVTVTPSVEAAAAVVTALKASNALGAERENSERNDKDEDKRPQKGLYETPLSTVLDALKRGVRSPKDLIKLLPWKGETVRTGKGMRYPDPKRRGDQLRIMDGTPSDSDPVKRGPYARVVIAGTQSRPFPLEGNPTLR